MGDVVFVMAGDATEAERLARPLRDRGWSVHTETHSDPDEFRSRAVTHAPLALVVSLDRNRDASCDLASALSCASVMDETPIVFVDGTAQDMDAARALRADAMFVSEAELPWAIKRAFLG